MANSFTLNKNKKLIMKFICLLIVSLCVAVLAICSLLPTVAKASNNAGKEAYAYIASTEVSDDTLVFAFDENKGFYEKAWNCEDTGLVEPDWCKFSKGVKHVYIDDSFVNARPKSCFHWFYCFSEIESIEGIYNLNTSEVVDMSSMFSNCQKLTSLDLSTFNTEKVENFMWMFSECHNLVDLDVSKFNTSSAKRMHGMFNNLWYIKKIDVSGFDTSKNTDFNCMFNYCSHLEELDVSNFKTSNVRDMYMMFAWCLNLESLDLTGWDVGNVRCMQNMFNNCTSLSKIYCNQDWNKKAVNLTNSTNMFCGCCKLPNHDSTREDIFYAFPNVNHRGYFTHKYLEDSDF